MRVVDGLFLLFLVMLVAGELPAAAGIVEKTTVANGLGVFVHEDRDVPGALSHLVGGVRSRRSGKPTTSLLMRAVALTRWLLQFSWTARSPKKTNNLLTRHGV